MIEIMVNKIRIAIPSMTPGGLSAQSSAHFGHCDVFTLVDIADGKIKEVSTVKNIPHEQGGCMAPVNFLKSNGVNAVMVGGIGMRPLMGFGQVGIQVYAGAVGAVSFIVEEYLAGNLLPAGEQDVCGHSKF